MNTRYTKVLLSLALLMSLGVSKTSAQLVVTPNQTAQQLVERLVGQNVAILNPSLNCPGAHNGQFTAVNSNLGLNGGIILATGTANSLAGPYSLGVQQEVATGGDPDLSALIPPYSTNDACVLEFDFVPDVDTVSTLRFEYVFGSEEYPGFTCSSFNDVFGFLLTGPGYIPAVNIALVPGTSIPVAINSVNSGTPSGGYSLSTCNAMGPGSPFPMYFVDNAAANGQTITLDGFTTKLEANAIVYPCDTYHMKLGVANASDHALQSAVFLKENSFSVDTVTLDLNGIIAADSGYLVEGCTPATIVALRTQPSPQKKKICLEYSGTAVNGVDYPLLPDTLIIPAGSTVAGMILNPLQDNMDEPGFETIQITRVNCCTKTPIDSVTIKIRDSLKMELLSEDVMICGSDTVVLHATGDPTFTYSWDPPQYVQNPTDTFSLAFPPVTTVYTVTATFQSCPPVSRSFTAYVEPVPIVNIMTDTALCIADPLTIKVDVQPSSFTQYNYTWFPPTHLDDPYVKEPKFFVEDITGDFTYVLAVQTPIGCTGKDTFTVTARPGVELTDVSGDFTAKYGDRVQLHVSGAPIYVWTPDRLLDFPNTADPTVTATDNEVFTVIGMNIWGCADTAMVRMNIDYSMFEIVPNAFSPNGDGLNDVFRVGSMKFQRLIEFRIFNRWGQEIFTSNDFNIGWDGTYKGQPQDPGVYQYLIRVTRPDGQLKTFKGDVTLVR